MAEEVKDTTKRKIAMVKLGKDMRSTTETAEQFIADSCQ